MPRPDLLRGLQNGEELLIDPIGIVRRMSKIRDLEDYANHELHLQAASAFCRGPDGIVIVRDILVEILQALGEPFGLEFVECTNGEGGSHAVGQAGVLYAQRVRDLDPETDDPGEEPSAYDMQRDGYFEAVFRVVAAEI